MAFLESIAVAKSIYDGYRQINEALIDTTVSIIHEISTRELSSAIKTLQDSKYSTNKEREFASAITQLRLAKEKSSSLAQKCKMSALMAFCYKVLHESALMQRFRNESSGYFHEYLDQSIKDLRWQLKVNFVAAFLPHGGVGRGMSMVFGRDEYNGLINKIEEMGISVDSRKISFIEANWFNGDTLINGANEIARTAENSFRSRLDQILSG